MSACGSTGRPGTTSRPGLGSEAQRGGVGTKSSRPRCDRDARRQPPDTMKHRMFAEFANKPAGRRTGPLQENKCDSLGQVASPTWGSHEKAFRLHEACPGCCREQSRGWPGLWGHRGLERGVGRPSHAPPGHHLPPPAGSLTTPRENWAM